MRVLFKSHNLIGDALNISPALRTWIKKWLEGNITANDVIFIQTLPDHVAPLYQGMVRDLFDVETVFNRPEATFDFDFDFNVSTAFDLCDRNKYHIAEGYAEMLGVKLEGGNERLKPVYIPEEDKFDDDKGLGVLVANHHASLLQGSILISMFSASCTSRDANTKGLPPNKMLPFDKWKPLMKLIRESYPDSPIRFLGSPKDMDDVNANSLYAKDIIRPGECMFGIPLNRLALIMQKAKLLVTIDNGMAHLGASQKVNTFEMYPRCLGIHYILPVGNPNLVYVQMDPVYVNPAQLVHGLRFAINKFKAQEKQ